MRFPVLSLAIVVLSACAPMVPVQPTRLDASPATAAPATLVVRDAVEFRLVTGYGRTVPAGSRWRWAGRLPEGDVYRPDGFVFSIEGRQVHEAYLVIAQGRLVGFYLPGESTWSPLAASLPLNLGDFR